MKVQSSTVALTSQHSLVEQYQAQESLQFWRDGGNNDAAAQTGEAGKAYKVAISELAKQLQAQASKTVEGAAADLEIPDKDELKLKLLEALLEGLTGKKFKFRTLEHLKLKQPQAAGVNRPAAQQGGQPRFGWGLVYNYHESTYESERMSFSSAGVVRTADGREINFALNLNMSREFYSETNINIRAGDALKDPLVINLDGSGVGLTQNKYQFDLDADGQADDISFVRPGSGFLSLDQNGDGVVNDGSELFGPQSGDGFADLSAYDADGNRWIDENDAVYGQLRIWTKDEAGHDTLFTLSQAGVGAIYLGNVSTEFALKGQTNELQGQLRSSGIFLRESGVAGTIQQVDLAV